MIKVVNNMTRATFTSQMFKIFQLFTHRLLKYKCAREIGVRHKILARTVDRLKTARKYVAKRMVKATAVKP